MNKGEIIEDAVDWKAKMTEYCCNAAEKAIATLRSKKSILSEDISVLKSESTNDKHVLSILYPAKGIILGEIIVGDEELKNGDFTIAGDTHSKPMRIRIVKAGERESDDELVLNQNDVVIIPKYGNVKVSIGSGKYQLFRYRDVIGKL